MKTLAKFCFQNPSSPRERERKRLTVSSNAVRYPIHGLEVGRLGRPDDDVLHVPPGELFVRLEGKGADASGQRRRCRRARVAARAKVMQVSGDHLLLARRAGTVGGGEGGGTGLAVPRHLAVLRRAADRQRPDTVRVTVAVAIVVVPATVPRRPDEN